MGCIVTGVEGRAQKEKEILKSPAPCVVPMIIDMVEQAPVVSLFVPFACQSAPMDLPHSRDPRNVVRSELPRRGPTTAVSVKRITCPTHLIFDKLVRTTAHDFRTKHGSAFSHLRKSCNFVRHPLYFSLRRQVACRSGLGGNFAIFPRKQRIEFIRKQKSQKRQNTQSSKSWL